MAPGNSPTGRREPPAFRRVSVARTKRLGPRMVRITFTGDELRGLEITEPAASVRLLLPHPDEDLTMPTWNGNEFLRDDGSRPIIRTFTPRRLDPDRLTLDLDLVLHPAGQASAWALGATSGAEAAISGPGRGYQIDPAANDFLIVGDESAIPAISQLVEWVGPHANLRVHIEVDDEFGTVGIPGHSHLKLAWHELGGRARGSLMVEAIAGEQIDEATAIWCAGQAAAMQQIRNHLFKERGIARSNATVRGYWK